MSDNWTKVLGRYKIEDVASVELHGVHTRIWVTGEQQPITILDKDLATTPIPGDWVVIEQKFRVGNHTELKVSIDPVVTISDTNALVLDKYLLHGKKLLALLRTNLPEFDSISENSKIAILMNLKDHDDAIEFINLTLASHKVYSYTYPQAIESIMLRRGISGSNT